MRADDLDLSAMLEIRPESATVRFAGQRALIFDAVALGLLRKELIASLGTTAARGVLTRFGYAHGWRMAETIGAAFAWDSSFEWGRAGPLLCSAQGLLRAEPGRGPLSPTGTTWRDSYEAEQHVLHLGRAEGPVCWTLCGLASGWISRIQGEELYVLEDRCVGRGDAACHVYARTRAGWDAGMSDHLPYFERAHLDAQLGAVTGALKRVERQLARKRREFAELIGAEPPEAGIVAASAGMRRVLDLARRVAGVDSTVLIRGESGAGKERVAQFIHARSAREGGPFLAVNCGAVVETLLESELFGHRRGAFTGAMQDRIGLLEAASGGTLLLDEIGEIPAAMQVKLLRALQEREIRRVGENQARPIDVRVLAATNRDLARAVAEGAFRSDLYYRLKVIELTIPPLRERVDDILPLARMLLGATGRRLGRAGLTLSPRAAELLLRHDWPGNVRELGNAVERAVALARGPAIEPEDLPDELRDVRSSAPRAAAIRLDELERAHILAVLDSQAGNKTRAAALLGISIATLHRKLRRYSEA